MRHFKTAKEIHGTLREREIGTEIETEIETRIEVVIERDPLSFFSSPLLILLQQFDGGNDRLPSKANE